MPRRKPAEATPTEEVQKEQLEEPVSQDHSQAAQLKSIELGLPLPELRNRLKDLLEYLADVDQEDEVARVVVSKFTEVLARPGLVHHDDKDVQLSVASCLAHVLRIFAPEAPYKKSQFRSIFTLFLEQLKGIAKINDSAYTRYFALLENLSSVQAFIVCAQLGHHDIVADLCRMIFTVIREDHAHKVHAYFLEVLGSTIEDHDNISQDLLEIILEQILETNQKEKPAAYALAKRLIDRCHHQIQASVLEFFSNIFVARESDKPSTSELAPFVYDIIYALQQINPNTLFAVLPQLEEQLKTEDLETRVSVTRLLARMFSSKGSTLAISNRPLFSAFLRRFIDIESAIRLDCVSHLKYFFVYHKELVDDIQRETVGRLNDPDDTVRHAAVLSVFEATGEDINSVPLKVLEEVATRLLDKKANIRREAILRFADLYKRACTKFGEPLTWEKNEKDLFGWIPSQVLRAYACVDTDTRLNVERVLERIMTPFDLNSADRAIRMLHIVSSLDEYAVRALSLLLREKRTSRDAVKAFIASRMDGNITDEVLREKLLAVARRLPEAKSAENLGKLVSMAEKKLWTLLGDCLESSVDFAGLRGKRSEILKRLAAKQPVADVVKAMIDRAIMGVIDSTNLPQFLSELGQHLNETEVTSNCITFLLDLAKTFPALFKTSETYGELVSFLSCNDNEIVLCGLKILSIVGDRLVECSQPLSRALKADVIEFALHGMNKQAKYAVRVINTVFPDREKIITDLYHTILEDLKFDSKHLQAYLTSLSQIAQLQPKIFQSEQKTIVQNFLIKDLLSHNRSLVKKKGKKENSVDRVLWQHDTNFEIKCKVLAIKVLVRRVLGDHAEVHLDALFNLLFEAIEKDGELCKEENTPEPDRSRIRLAAACGLLRLARVKSISSKMKLEHFQSLALIIQDDCFEVRRTFMEKLNTGLQSLALPLQYLSIFALAATDVEKENRDLATKFIRANIKRRKTLLETTPSAKHHQNGLLPEYAIPYLIHLLAHDPKFSTENLKDFQKFLSFFIDSVATESDNFNFLNSVVEIIKQSTDRQDPPKNDEIYTLCDLALALILQKAQTSQWVVKPFPGDPLLPSALFKADSGQGKAGKSFLPAGFKISKTVGAAVHTPSPKKPQSAVKEPTNVSRLNHSAKAVKPVSLEFGDGDESEPDDESGQNDSRSQVTAKSTTSSKRSTKAGDGATVSSKKSRPQSPQSPKKRPAKTVDEEDEEEDENEEDNEEEEDVPEPSTTYSKRVAPQSLKKPSAKTARHQDEEDEVELEQPAKPASKRAGPASPLKPASKAHTSPQKSTAAKRPASATAQQPSSPKKARHLKDDEEVEAEEEEEEEEELNVRQGRRLKKH